MLLALTQDHLRLHLRKFHLSMELKRVVEEINKLDFTYREVLSLFYLNEMSPSEISDLLEIPYNTVRSKINRGRKKLLKSLW